MLLIELSFLTRMNETNEEKSNHDERKCFLGDVKNPFAKFDDCEFQTRLRFKKMVLHRLFNIIRKDYELQCANNAVPGMLQLFLFLRIYAKEHFQQTDEDLRG